MERKTMELDELMDKLGEFGRYQCFQFLLHILAAMTAAMHLLALVTVAGLPDHRCAIENVDNDLSPAHWNSTEVLSWIPMAPNGLLESCHMFDGKNNTVKCDKWIYDATYQRSSRAIEWNFVCDQRWMGALVQTAYLSGVFTGSIALGSLADKYGRKVIFCWCGFLQLVLGVAVAFIPEYWSYLIATFFYGMVGTAGSFLAGFVLTMELVGPSKRTLCGIAFQVASAVGIMMVAGYGALIDNRVVLQVVYGLHSLLLIPHFWLMDESPRWLWSQGRQREAVTIINKALESNSLKETIDPNDYAQRGRVVETVKEPAAGLLNLFKTPNLRKKTLNICLCWFANSLVYYGLSLSSGRLHGNPYLMLFFMGLVELPSYAASIYYLDILGRRPIFTSLMLVGGFCCIVATFLKAGSLESITVVMLGKCFISGSLAIIYNYAAELFPTVVRNSAIGLGSMCGRLAAALTPLVTLLDSFDPKVPAVIFGVVALVSGYLSLFLPETMGRSMPQTIQDGENFGTGDTCFTVCLGNAKDDDLYSDDPEAALPLKS